MVCESKYVRRTCSAAATLLVSKLGSRHGLGACVWEKRNVNGFGVQECKLAALYGPRPEQPNSKVCCGSMSAQAARACNTQYGYGRRPFSGGRRTGVSDGSAAASSRATTSPRVLPALRAMRKAARRAPAHQPRATSRPTICHATTPWPHFDRTTRDCHAANHRTRSAFTFTAGARAGCAYPTLIQLKRRRT